MKLAVTIRKGNLNDLLKLQMLFADTITSVCSADYNPEQIKIWLSGVRDTNRWHEIMNSQEVLIAETDNKIVGFATLKYRSFIDMFYIHKAFQRQNIASRLYTEVEKTARESRVHSLSADVSITARPFFEKMGFRVLRKQTVVRQDVEFINFKMEKILKEAFNRHQ